MRAACVPLLKTGHRVPATTPRPTASSPLFSQIASRWFDILPWQPEEANLDLARAIPPPPRARHCTCPPARPSAILEEPPGFRRQDLRRDASEQPRWLISDASERPRAEPTRLTCRLQRTSARPWASHAGWQRRLCSLGLFIGVTSVASGGNRHSLNTRARDYLTGRLVCGGRLRGWAGGPVTGVGGSTSPLIA